MLRFLISFLISFLLVVLFVHFSCPFTPANFIENVYTSYVHIYIFLLFYFTIHLIMTEARSKRRVLPLVFIVKSFTKSLLISSCIRLINQFSNVICRATVTMQDGDSRSSRQCFFFFNFEQGFCGRLVCRRFLQNGDCL